MPNFPRRSQSPNTFADQSDERADWATSQRHRAHGAPISLFVVTDIVEEFLAVRSKIRNKFATSGEKAVKNINTGQADRPRFEITATP